MTTLLAHIKIKPGSEAQWEEIMADMIHQTWSTETGVKRYEYWKGEAPNLYYCLLSFDDKVAFYRHQMSPHHEGHDFAAVLEDIRLEYVDPVKGSGGGLPPTVDAPLPADADADLMTAQERFPITIPAWWSGRA
jgi:quinol monooxygenase YgiN